MLTRLVSLHSAFLMVRLVIVRVLMGRLRIALSSAPCWLDDTKFLSFVSSV